MPNIRNITDIYYDSDTKVLSYDLNESLIYNNESVDKLVIAKTLGLEVTDNLVAFSDGNSESFEGDIFIEGILEEEYEFTETQLKQYLVLSDKPMSVKQAAEYLGVATSTMYNGMMQRIKRYKMAGRWRFYKHDLDAFIKAKEFEPMPVV